MCQNTDFVRSYTTPNVLLFWYQSVKFRINHYSWRIERTTEAGQSKVEIFRDCNVTPSFVFILLKYFQYVRFPRKNHKQYRPWTLVTKNGRYFTFTAMLNRSAAVSPSSCVFFMVPVRRDWMLIVSRKLRERWLFTRRRCYLHPSYVCGQTYPFDIVQVW